MGSILSKNKINLFNLNIILLFVGYFWINYISHFFYEYESLISIIFRYTQIFLALLSIFLRFPLFIINAKKIYLLLWLFILFYLIRLIYDYNTIHEIDNQLDHIYQFGVISLIPALSILTIKKEEFEELDVYLKYLLFIVITLSLPILAVNSEAEKGRLSINENLNSQYLGQFAVTLSLLAYYHLFQKDKNKIFNTILFILGIIVMGLAGSRSPLVSFIIVVIVNTLSVKKKTQSLIIFILFSVLTYLFFDRFYYLLDTFGSNFIDRINASILSGDTSGRDVHYFAAIDQFLQNPILGGAHYLQKNIVLGKYPHNLVLESFMALGILGGMIFSSILIKSFKSGFYQIKQEQIESKKYSWTFVIYLQFLIFAFFSGSLYSSYYFWGSLILCLHYTNQIMNSINKRNEPK
jgi:hypothetical protein